MRLAQRGDVLEGTVPLSELPRLADLLADNAGGVRVRLRFGRDPQGIATVETRLEADLLLRCQACLEPYRQSLAASTTLALVSSEGEAERLPATYDALELGEEPFVLRTLVEDELILALPIIPRHPRGECPGEGWVEQNRAASNDGEAEENPFAVLKRLKNKESPEEEP